MSSFYLLMILVLFVTCYYLLKQSGICKCELQAGNLQRHHPSSAVNIIFFTVKLCTLLNRFLRALWMFWDLLLPQTAPSTSSFTALWAKVSARASANCFHSALVPKQQLTRWPTLDPHDGITYLHPRISNPIPIQSIHIQPSVSSDMLEIIEHAGFSWDWDCLNSNTTYGHLNNNKNNNNNKNSNKNGPDKEQNWGNERHNTLNIVKMKKSICSSKSL